MPTRKKSTKKKTAKTKLTLKQTKFIKYYFKCSGNGAEAARRAGYKGNQDTLKAVASENLAKPYILEAIDKAKTAQGLTSEYLLAKHKELLEADRSFAVGEEIAHSPDSTVRLGALKLAYELEGRLIRKIDHTIKEYLHEDLKDKTVEELLEMANDYERKNPIKSKSAAGVNLQKEN